MSNPDDESKFVRGQRKGTKGRIFNVPINVHVDSTNFKGATARAEIFVPDTEKYQPVTYNGPLIFYGLRNVNRYWIPGQASVKNRPFLFYPPPDKKQQTSDVKKQGQDRIQWTKGAPTPQDMVLRTFVQFPHQTTPQDRVTQRPMPMYQNPVFRPVNEKLLEKKLIDGKWGAYIDITFPARTVSTPKNKDREWILESDPIKKLFIPYTPEYKYYKIKTVNHKGKLRNGDKFIRVPEQWYRFWPPMFPGQHIKKDWRKKVSRANMNSLDRFDFDPTKDPLPMFIDINVPKEEWKEGTAGKVHGYTYQNLSYPPLVTRASTKTGDNGRTILNYNKIIFTFPDATTRQFVPDSEYYKPVKLPTPLTMSFTETYEKFPGEKKYLYEEYEGETPEGYEFWFFPPPKNGQSMDKLTEVQRKIARSNNGQRVFIFNNKTKQFSDVPGPARGKISDEEARRKKSRKGSIGGQVGQPSPLMRYALQNRAKKKAEQMPPPEPSPEKSESPMSISPPRAASPPSRKRSGEQSPPSPSKRGRSQSPPPAQQNPLYFYNEEEAGSGSESEGEDSPTKKPGDPKPPAEK